MAVPASEQLVCLRDITRTLEDAFSYFHKGPSGQSSPSGSYLSVPDTTEVLTMLLQLLSPGPQIAPETHYQLLHASFEQSTFAVLVAYATHPLIFSPDVQAGYSLQQTFVQLRITALQVINRIAMSCSADPSLSVRCVKGFEEHRLVSGLMALLSSPATFETLRVAAIEAIFVFVLRVPGAKHSFVSGHGHQAVMSCLVLEPAAVVRNYLCATIREVAVDHSAEIADADLLRACLKLISTDDSADVRSLCTEIIDISLKGNTLVGGFLESPDELSIVIKDRLERDQSSQVVESVAKLAESFCHAAHISNRPALFDVFVTNHVYRAMIMALRHGPPAAAAAARALRFTIQYTPPNLQVGYHIVTEFQSLSTLLKCVMDLHSPTNGGHDGSPVRGVTDVNDSGKQLLSVELGVAVSMLLAQSPVNRQQLYREMHSFPLWSTALREALSGFLNAAAVDYFANIDLLDVTAHRINVVHEVEWGEGMKPKKASIRGVFTQQELRVKEQRQERPTPPPHVPEHEQRRQMKLTFVLLNYAVHLSLAPEEASGVDQTVMMNSQTPNRAVSAGGPGGFTSPGPSMPAGVGGGMVPQPGMQSSMAPPPPGSPRMSTGRSQSNQRRTPMFPSSRQSGNAAELLSQPRTQKEMQESSIAYDKFDSCFKFTIKYAESYAKKVKKNPVYEPTPDGFVVRKEGLKNPWGPLVKKQPVKSWVVSDIKEGDMFYFAIPFDDLKLFALDTVIDRAKRHHATLKKHFITTPQVARGRRWFLHDMMHNVMPKCLEFLTELKGYVEKHGGDNVRFPLFLFREKEMHVGERALHPSNLAEVVEQIRFYFSQSPGELLGVDPEYVSKVEDKIRDLSSRRHGDPNDFPAFGDDDDGYPGHGGLSSDSDGE